jgi:choline dehydrogenase-like flavoprotein
MTIVNVSAAAPHVDGTYDVVLIGSGFASSFFLHRYLQHASPSARILVLERGEFRDHRWHLAHRNDLQPEAVAACGLERSTKPWLFRLAFGGSSNCWWACTPRFLPEDFRLQSTYGVGRDWPVSYDDLEEYYCDAEDIMAVSGPDDGYPSPRSRPYPQPPHRLTDPDLLFKKRFPHAFFNQPAARPSRATESGRPRCCATGVCSRCPIDSKFTVLNTLSHLYRSEPRVTLLTGANAIGVEVAGNRATGVRFQHAGAEGLARAELVGLGANALFNPYLLLRSGLSDGMAGKGLLEQVSRNVIVDLRGVNNFQGSTSITGHGYMLYSGAHRRSHAAALIETWNVPMFRGAPLLRDERGKWRQRLRLKFIFEDLPRPENQVTIGSDQSRPEVEYGKPSAYAQRAVEALEATLPSVLEALPVERYYVDPDFPQTEGHILGTTIMGNDSALCVVDRQLLHHRVRNLLVLGGSVFPTISPANPTLTICALSLWAADNLMSSSGAKQS